MDDQRVINDRAVAAVQEFLGGPWPESDGWTFDFGRHLSSNWGAVYGGAMAAAAVALARITAPDRSPRSLHVQMLRSLQCGPAKARTGVRRHGRTVAAIEVELYDSQNQLAAVALVTSVATKSLARAYSNTVADVFDVDHEPVELEAAHTADAPISDALKMRTSAESFGNVITNVPRSITGDPARCMMIVPPWDDVTTTGPELACLIADATNGMPIVNSLSRLGPVSWPNTDLTLRFTNAAAHYTVIASGTLVAVDDGTTTVSINVQSAGRWLAHGHSTSVLLPIPHAEAPRRAAAVETAVADTRASIGSPPTQ